LNQRCREKILNWAPERFAAVRCCEPLESAETLCRGSSSIFATSPVSFVDFDVDPHVCFGQPQRAIDASERALSENVHEELDVCRMGDGEFIFMVNVIECCGDCTPSFRIKSSRGSETSVIANVLEEPFRRADRQVAGRMVQQLSHWIRTSAWATRELEIAVELRRQSATGSRPMFRSSTNPLSFPDDLLPETLANHATHVCGFRKFWADFSRNSEAFVRRRQGVVEFEMTSPG
jgi:hypothetical protein